MSKETREEYRQLLSDIFYDYDFCCISTDNLLDDVSLTEIGLVKVFIPGFIGALNEELETNLSEENCKNWQTIGDVLDTMLQKVA